MPIDRVTGKETPLYSDPSPASDYIPAKASPNFAALVTNIQNLINALSAHPALKEAHKAAPPNQPPPKEKQNKVYFMHDFCCRSRHMLLQIEPVVETKKAKEDFLEVFQRCIYCKMLIDDKAGKLSMMMKEKPGEEIDFGQGVKDAANRIGELPDEAAVFAP